MGFKISAAFSGKNEKHARTPSQELLGTIVQHCGPGITENNWPTFRSKYYWESNSWENRQALSISIILRNGPRFVQETCPAFCPRSSGEISNLPEQRNFQKKGRGGGGASPAGRPQFLGGGRGNSKKNAGENQNHEGKNCLKGINSKVGFCMSPL